MEKNILLSECGFREYTEDMRMEYRSYCASLSKESGFGALMGKLQRALSVEAHHDDLVVKYIQLHDDACIFSHS